MIETFIHNRYSGTGRGEELLRMIRTRIAVHIWRHAWQDVFHPSINKSS